MKETIQLLSVVIDIVQSNPTMAFKKQEVSEGDIKILRSLSKYPSIIISHSYITKMTVLIGNKTVINNSVRKGLNNSVAKELKYIGDT